jgi:hypothetical protein
MKHIRDFYAVTHRAMCGEDLGPLPLPCTERLELRPQGIKDVVYCVECIKAAQKRVEQTNRLSKYVN